MTEKLKNKTKTSRAKRGSPGSGAEDQEGLAQTVIYSLAEQG